MNAKNVLGWIAVVIGTLVASFWAFWGTIEAFHEGWCKPQLWMRLLQLAAYLTPVTVFSGLTVLGIRWPRVGATLFALVGIVIAVLIEVDQAGIRGVLYLMITAAPVLLGLTFLFGRPKPKMVAYAISIGLPVLIVIACGIEPVCRVSTRFDDGDRGARLVEGNGVTLLWAPAALVGTEMEM